MSFKKISTAALIIAIISCFFIFDLGHYLSLDYFLSQRDEIIQYAADQPVLSAATFFALYVLVTAFSLPAAAVITLAGGAIFGLWKGLLLVSFASTIGATLAFLMARTVLRDYVENKFSHMLSRVNEGIAKEGSFYLFGLRLVPLFPFFAVNLLMGLVQISTLRYFIVSQVGMLPGTFIFVNAGTQLAQVNELGQILSPTLLISFAALGVFPLLAKRLLEKLQASKQLRAYAKPKTFDSNLVVIGAGSGGLVSAYIAAAVKAKVDLIEKHQMGGDCLNTGCVPSKALIRSAKINHHIKTASHYGLSVQESSVDFRAVMERVQTVIDKIEPHDSIERYTGLGVDCHKGEAEIIDPYRVKVNDQIITTRNIVVATGARPRVPELPGLSGAPYFTSDTIWSLREKPKNLVVIGAGPIGCELAQSFYRLGVTTTLVNDIGRILPKEDADMALLVRQRMESEGLPLKLERKAVAVHKTENGYELELQHANETERLPFDCLLFSVGRIANTKGFGLENLNIDLSPQGTIKVNEYLQTSMPNIYAVGDVVGPYQLTHAASHQAWYAAVNALFGSLKRFKVDYSVMPWATFTDPEIARVGLSEDEAIAANIPYQVVRYGIDDLDRAIADGSDFGGIKLLVQPGKDKVLGACIVGTGAGDLISEFVSAMKHGIGLNKVLGTIHIYPTMAEANKYVAGEWKRQNVSAKALSFLTCFHHWRR
jgi:pyruvate/2-oxoglutarate dehydrogenase complex dihydrolipoamide dehydrogenase (E3) component/uncharacterized membrane protein YdjX (TVP38/TMEM64 family)